MKERLKDLRKHLNLTQSEFGKKIGMSDVAISYMESGRTAINNQNVNLICLTFGVNEDWFRFGIGEMINEDAQYSEDEKRLFHLSRKLSPKAMKMLIDYAKKLLADEMAFRVGAESLEKGEESA
ncbi:MAG: helix-turn-helix domain-containing protein [Treponema sp.]|nr:helix-turn-helix domain-containing protein [Treponema sp.]